MFTGIRTLVPVATLPVLEPEPVFTGNRTPVPVTTLPVTEYRSRVEPESFSISGYVIPGHWSDAPETIVSGTIIHSDDISATLRPGMDRNYAGCPVV